MEKRLKSVITVAQIFRKAKPTFKQTAENGRTDEGFSTRAIARGIHLD
ncbi:MAG: hypothetical protein AAGA28_19625 [Pseudomonadota bacterium]